MDERSRAILRSLLQLANADGLVVSEEQALLERVISDLGGSPGELEDLDQSLPHTLVPLETVLTGPQERREVLKLLVELSLCDGNRSHSEVSYLSGMAERLGVSRAELTDIQTQVEQAELDRLRSRANEALRQIQDVWLKGRA